MNDVRLVCLGCGGQMASFQRVGSQVDQCQNCKGIFLDGGELQHQPTPSRPLAYEQRAYQQRGCPPAGCGYGEHHGGYHSSRRGFLHEPFDD